MGNLDLDAARAARDEARGETEPPTVVRCGRTYVLTPVLYVDAADAWRRSDGREFIRLVLADPGEADDFVKGDGKPESRLEWADINAMLPLWHVESGESSASGASSTNGGTRSRPTSKQRTD